MDHDHSNLGTLWYLNWELLFTEWLPVKPQGLAAQLGSSAWQIKGNGPHESPGNLLIQFVASFLSKFDLIRSVSQEYNCSAWKNAWIRR